MRVKSFVFGLVVFFFLSASVYAQMWPSIDDIIATIQTKMHLTTDQLNQVRLIIKENLTERQHIQPQLAHGLTQAQSDPLDSELYTRLSEVLTRSQMVQWESIHEGILDKIDATS